MGMTPLTSLSRLRLSTCQKTTYEGANDLGSLITLCGLDLFGCSKLKDVLVSFLGHGQLLQSFAWEISMALQMVVQAIQ